MNAVDTARALEGGVADGNDILSAVISCNNYIRFNRSSDARNDIRAVFNIRAVGEPLRCLQCAANAAVLSDNRVRLRVGGLTRMLAYSLPPVIASVIAPFFGIEVVGGVKYGTGGFTAFYAGAYAISALRTGGSLYYGRLAPFVTAFTLAAAGNEKERNTDRQGKNSKKCQDFFHFYLRVRSIFLQSGAKAQPRGQVSPIL